MFAWMLRRTREPDPVRTGVGKAGASVDARNILKVTDAHTNGKREAIARK
jgi:ethanolamine ammonia-lyase small subunit